VEKGQSDGRHPKLRQKQEQRSRATKKKQKSQHNEKKRAKEGRTTQGNERQ